MLVHSGKKTGANKKYLKRKNPRWENRLSGKEDTIFSRDKRSQGIANPDRKSLNKYGSSINKLRKASINETLFGRAYTVRVTKNTGYGAFVRTPQEIIKSLEEEESDSRLYAINQYEVLLPFSEQLGRPKVGENVRVYFYEDKGQRLACTMRIPILKEGELGILKVVDVTSIGAFLDNGMPKEVLLPYREQIISPKPGEDVLVWLYTDKSGRTAATMRVYAHLETKSPYREGDQVKGFVYEINPKMGLFVAVDNKYYGMIPISETFRDYSYGDIIDTRVARVRPDGKLDLLVRAKLYETVEQDAELILRELKKNNGFLPYGDRSDAKFIRGIFAMSKNQFKRALGHLYKNHIVELDRVSDTIKLVKNDG